MQTQMLIGSKFATGTRRAETILNPKTEETIIELPEASPDQVHWAVDAASRAFKTWSRTTPAERSALMLKLADRIEAEAEDFAALEALNCGKPPPRRAARRDAGHRRLLPLLRRRCRTQHGAVAGEYLPGHTSMIRRDPIGVVASIAPWNYPLMMAAWKLAPALAAGNTVVIKPSEQTPLTALKLAQSHRRGLPEGVVNVVVGRGETVGSALIEHPSVRMISLTGDIATGRKVLGRRRPSIKRTHLELGGKAPVIVFDDADIEAVVEGIKRVRLLQCRPGLHRRLPHLRRQEDLRQARRRSVFRRGVEPQVRRAQRRRERHRPADLRPPARARRRLRRARHGARPRRDHRPAASRPPARLLLRADGRRRRAAVDEIVRREVFGPVVSVTPLLGRREAVELGQRLAITDSPPRSGQRTSARAMADRGRSCNMAAPGSTATSCWSARCRTAA